MVASNQFHISFKCIFCLGFLLILIASLIQSNRNYWWMTFNDTLNLLCLCIFIPWYSTIFLSFFLALVFFVFILSRFAIPIQVLISIYEAIVSRNLVIIIIGYSVPPTNCTLFCCIEQTNISIRASHLLFIYHLVDACFR